MTPPSTPCEYTLVEKPLIDLLTTEYGSSDGRPGYVYILIGIFTTRVSDVFLCQVEASLAIMGPCLASPLSQGS
jgi:hypothetical protein